MLQMPRSTTDGISIHAPREGGDSFCWLSTVYSTARISIHAPREGGDHNVETILYGMPISIHAPREGGD